MMTRTLIIPTLSIVPFGVMFVTRILQKGKVSKVGKKIRRRRGLGQGLCRLVAMERGSRVVGRTWWRGRGLPFNVDIDTHW
jgi:hypothetical protein